MGRAHSIINAAHSGISYTAHALSSSICERVRRRRVRYTAVRRHRPPGGLRSSTDRDSKLPQTRGRNAARSSLREAQAPPDSANPRGPRHPTTHDCTVLINWTTPQQRCYYRSTMPPPRLASAILAVSCRFRKPIAGKYHALSSSHCPTAILSILQ
jgi:hypothetical protein